MYDLTTEDRLDLHELVARITHAIDFSNPDAVAELFTPDGVMQGEESPRKGGGVRYRTQGREELRTYIAAAVEKRPVRGRHWTSNVVIEPSETGAVGTSYLIFLTIDPQNSTSSILLTAVHHDQYLKTTDGWKFAKRTIIFDT